MEKEQSGSGCTKCECSECKQQREWLFEYLWGCVEALGGLVSQWYKERHGEWPVFKFYDEYYNEEFVRFDAPEKSWEIIPDSPTPPSPAVPGWLSRLARRGIIEHRSRCTHIPPDICERCQYDPGQDEYDEKLKSQPSAFPPLSVRQG